MRIFGKSSVDRLAEAVHELQLAREKEATEYHAEIVELRATVAVLSDKVRPLVASMELAWEKVDKAIKRLNYRAQALSLKEAEEHGDGEPVPAPESPIERLRARRALRK